MMTKSAPPITTVSKLTQVNLQIKYSLTSCFQCSSSLLQASKLVSGWHGVFQANDALISQQPVYIEDWRGPWGRSQSHRTDTGLLIRGRLNPHTSLRLSSRKPFGNVRQPAYDKLLCLGDTADLKYGSPPSHCMTESASPSFVVCSANIHRARQI